MNQKEKHSLVSKRARLIAFLVVLLVALGFVFNKAIFRETSRASDSGRGKYDKQLSYSEDESAVLKFLVEDTPSLGKIPQTDYLEKKTGLKLEQINKVLLSLAEKQDIALDDNGGIESAFPWTVDDKGIRVYLLSDSNQVSSPLDVASSLYAFSVPKLIDSDVRIEARLADTGDTLAVEIRTGEISYANHLGAVVYRTNDYRDSRFYESPKGAEADHPDDFDFNKVIRLDKALSIGNIIAGEIGKKMGKNE